MKENPYERLFGKYEAEVTAQVIVELIRELGRNEFSELELTEKAQKLLGDDRDMLPGLSKLVEDDYVTEHCIDLYSEEDAHFQGSLFTATRSFIEMTQDALVRGPPDAK